MDTPIAAQLVVPNPPLTVGEMLTDPTTLVSLSLVLVLIFAAYGLSTCALGPNARKSTRFLFIWHIFDALIHFIFEGSFLYNCLFTYITVTAPEPTPQPIATSEAVAEATAATSKGFLNFFFASSATASASSSSLAATASKVAAKVADTLSEAPQQLAPTWLGHTDRLYGANHAPASNPFGALWRVYAQADFRWGVADANVVSIELLTVLIAGPLAVYVAYLLAKRDRRASVWMIVLATGEIYGGFMTFAPEWLTGSQNLDTSNWMYTWVYLFFFNTLWIWFPIYAIVWAYEEISKAFRDQEIVEASRKAIKEQKSL